LIFTFSILVSMKSLRVNYSLRIAPKRQIS